MNSKVENAGPCRKLLYVSAPTEEVMPEYNVPFGRVIPSYVSAYYAVGDSANGEKYARRILDIYEEDLEYYMSIEPEFSAQMVRDMFDAYRGVFAVYQAVLHYGENEAFSTEVADRFTNLTVKVQSSLNPIRKVSPDARVNINQTFDGFFNQIQGLN